jgi:hypothetical protein
MIGSIDAVDMSAKGFEQEFVRSIASLSLCALWSWFGRAFGAGSELELGVE